MSKSLSERARCSAYLRTCRMRPSPSKTQSISTFSLRHGRTGSARPMPTSVVDSPCRPTLRGHDERNSSGSAGSAPRPGSRPLGLGAEGAPDRRRHRAGAADRGQVALDKAATTSDTKIPMTAIQSSSGKTHSPITLVLFIGPHPSRRLRVLARRTSLGRHSDVHQIGSLPLQREHP
jgi:hypothetical protein